MNDTLSYLLLSRHVIATLTYLSPLHLPSLLSYLHHRRSLPNYPLVSSRRWVRSSRTISANYNSSSLSLVPPPPHSLRLLLLHLSLSRVSTPIKPLERSLVVWLGWVSSRIIVVRVPLIPRTNWPITLKITVKTRLLTIFLVRDVVAPLELLQLLLPKHFLKNPHSSHNNRYRDVLILEIINTPLTHLSQVSV